MVHTPPPEHRCSIRAPIDAWKHYGYSRPRHLSNTMKNFVRLVQFAWRYKIRFGLSVACAAMVALLSFTEMGAVYPCSTSSSAARTPSAGFRKRSSASRPTSSRFDNREIEVAQVSSRICRADSLAVINSTNGIARSMSDFEKKEAELRKHERNRRCRRPERAMPIRTAGTRSFVLEKLRRELSRGGGAGGKNCKNALGFLRKGDAKSLASSPARDRARDGRQRETSESLQVGPAICQYDICRTKASRHWCS